MAEDWKWWKDEAYKAQRDLAESWVQIAAKDAELERLRTLVGRWIDGVPLAAPARETDND